MTSTTMHISLSENLKDKIQSRISEGTFSNSSDYVRHLVREDISKQEERKQLTQMIQEGIDSGMSEKGIDEIFSDIKKRIRQKA